ncbi:hypothetical protein, partial [Acinetobacter pittii]
MKYNINKLKTSWTRYSIVQNLDLLYDRETLISVFQPDVEKDEPVIKAFLGISSLEIKNIPEYWFEIIKFPEEKKLFGMFSLILTHHEVIEIFKSSSNDEMGGVLKIKPANKMYTNIRSSLVESGASIPLYRRAEDVHYNFSKIFEREEIGFLFKLLLIDRLNKISLDSSV